MEPEEMKPKIKRDCQERCPLCSARCYNPKDKHSKNLEGTDIHAHWVGESMKSHEWVVPEYLKGVD